MALQSSTIPVLFSGGLDQKTAEQLVIPGKFLVLENCVRRKLGKVQKRYGYTQLGNVTLADTTISSGSRLAKLNSDLLLMNSDSLYSYSTSNDKWIDKGDITSVLVDTAPSIRNSNRQAMPDLDTMSGITVTAWEDSRGGVRASVVDDSTGASILYDQVIDAAGSRPKVVAINGNFLILYRNSANFLVCKIVSSTDPTSIGSAITIDGVAYDTFDACAHGVNGLVAGVPTASGQIKLSYFTSLGVIGSGGNGLATPTTITEAAVDVLTVVSDYDNGRLYVAYKGSANNLKVAGYTSPFLITSTASVETLVGIRNIGAALNSSSSLRVFYEISAADLINYRIKSATALFNGTTTSITVAAAEFKRSVGLVSKPFLQGDHVYVNAAFDTILQPTYFTIREDGFIVSRMQPGTGGGLTADSAAVPVLKSGLCRVADNSFLLQVRLKLQAAEDGTVLSTSFGLDRTTLTFDSSNLFSEQLGQNLHISGGVLLAYDGVSATELGFHVFPEGETLADGGAATGSLDAGDYRVCVLYEWVDAQGQRHQSAPSIPQTVTVVATGSIVVSDIPYLRLTSKFSPRSDVKVVIYRTVADGVEVFYRDTEIDNVVTLDEPTTAPILTQADTALVLNEVLYTVGGVLENIAPPASRTVVKHKNRLFLGATGDGASVAYSKEAVFGEGVAFSDGFTIAVEPGGGDITALASLDDKLVIFKRDRVYAFVGDGPLETGAQNDFTLPQLITGDVGAIDQASVVAVPTGIMFKSDKGIYLLTRSLSFEYVGAPVEDYNNLLITSATLLEDVNEVRFTTSDGQALIYSYFFDQWSTFTDYESVSAINALGSYCHLRSDGKVRKESTAYLNAGARYSMAIETSWLAFAGIQGYQRVWRYAFLGDFITDHYTKIKLAYDYENAFTETVYFNVDEGLDLSYYGDDPTYGESTVYGGSGSSVYQFESVPRRQKCESIKFRIEDIDTKTEAGGGSFNLVSLTLEVGIKKGIDRLTGGKTVGSL